MRQGRIFKYNLWYIYTWQEVNIHWSLNSQVSSVHKYMQSIMRQLTIIISQTKLQIQHLYDCAMEAVCKKAIKGSIVNFSYVYFLAL